MNDRQIGKSLHEAQRIVAEQQSAALNREGAAPRAEGLNVERLEEAMEQHSLHDHNPLDMEGCSPACAESILARLSRPSDD